MNAKREIQVWTNAYIFQADTEAEARAFYDETVFKKGDWEGVENLVSIMGLNSQSIPAPVLQHLKEHFIAGWVGYPLIGTKEQVVDGLALLARAGFDGIVLTWPRYIEGMQQFKAETFRWCSRRVALRLGSRRRLKWLARSDQKSGSQRKLGVTAGAAARHGRKTGRGLPVGARLSVSLRIP